MHLTEHQWDILVGLFFVVIAGMFLIFINDFSIDVPTASYQAESAAITPAFFPNLVCFAILAFGCGLAASSWSRMRWDKTHPEAVHDLGLGGKIAMLYRFGAMAVLVMLYYVAEWLGIVLAGFIFYVLFAYFTGERRPVRAVVGAVLTSVILYILFVKAASVPLPLGVLEDIF